MPWYDIFRSGKFKRELEKEKAKNRKILKASQQLKSENQKILKASQQLKDKYVTIQKYLSAVERMEAIGLQKSVSKLSAQREVLQTEVASLSSQVRELRYQIIQLDETILMQSFGIYETRYNLEESSLYKARLDQIRAEQRRMTKDNTAVGSATDWVINGSAAEGRRMIKDYVKLILRSFNNECDATIINAKYNNVVSLEKKIYKAAETLNKLGQRMSIAITSQYVNLKIQELYLSYEYALKVQAEKEEQRRIREQMREEEKVRRELERERKKLKKEATHFTKAIVSVNEQIENARTNEEREALVIEKEKIQQELNKVNQDISNNDFRAQNTRAGHVYIISNIGSFGEEVYKIGMTRRLEPQDRIDELGDASVPYRFDVHAMIFSEDAPTLENALHKAFSHKRLNFVNLRREFFRVSLSEIAHVVKENFNKSVEFTMLAAAEEYRQSVQIGKTLQTTDRTHNAVVDTLS